MKWIIIIFAALIFLLAAVLFNVCRRQRHTLDGVRKLLGDAVAGTLTEGRLEENEVSEIESEMWRFLNDCETSKQNQMEQKQRIQTLISDISHQTVTCITNIRIYTELLGEQQDEWKNTYHLADEDADAELAAIRFQVEKLDFLIESLVKTSRLETGVITLQPQYTSIGEVLTKVRVQYRKKAETKQITLQIEPSEEKANLDVRWTAEALGNIVDNAIKYSHTGGTVRIHVIPYTLFLRIDVKDEGIGIEESDLAQIFMRFYRAAAVRREPGVGIGLYLARQIVSLQGGYIKAASTPGAGSTFSIFLNRTESEPLEKYQD